MHSKGNAERTVLAQVTLPAPGSTTSTRSRCRETLHLTFAVTASIVAVSTAQQFGKRYKKPIRKLATAADPATNRKPET